MVKTGEKCRQCRFWGLQTQTCDYMLITKRSRVITNGVRTDPKYCDKYEKGNRLIDHNEWIKEEFEIRKANRKYRAEMREMRGK